MSGKTAHYGGFELPLCQMPLVHPGTDVPRAQYDGKTRGGPWGYLCPDCFRKFGVGLGTGLGQRLVLDPPGEWRVGMLVQVRGGGGDWCELVDVTDGPLTWVDPDGLRVFGDPMMVEAVKP